ncbi:shikimate kinase [Anaerococcus porci]|uniref:shikimate kinase n=1 Tax=Anaerococcus porci TaxID=2652269 RepID=UPI002A765114|nr:shikimate kinase [Anaerococcus porci]MDY3006386.1 shikimate kinase [Anaerococcus porci]
MRNIKDIRFDIDKVDEKLIKLLEKRFDLSKEVSLYKKENNKPIFDKERENEILKNLEKENKKYGPYFREIYKTIMEQSKNLQKKCERYGLLGKKLGHSFSKIIHEKIGNYTYEYFEKDEDELSDFFQKRDFKAINVTIPYKNDVIKYLDVISDKAEKIGAVNTIVNIEGKLYGYNTDYEGFLYNLKKHKIDINGKKVLILGKGATSNTVKVVLEDLGAKKIVRLSRRFKPFFKDVSNYIDYQIIINTTPVGMFPNNEKKLSDINVDDFKNLEAFVDCIYNPFMTNLSIDSKIRGITFTTGLDMLIAQGVRAAEYFLGKKIDDKKICQIRSSIFKEQMNIALIGMPGSGKTSIASILSKKLDRELIDIDCEFEKKYGNIEDFFKRYGEDEFRIKESEILKEYGKKVGLVIACGGGVIKKGINYYYLKQNSFIVNIKRDLDKLAIEGRPLSLEKRIEDLYKERKDLYEKFEDVSVENIDINDCSDEIIRIFYENISY